MPGEHYVRNPVHSFISGRPLRLAAQAGILAVLVGGTAAYAVNDTTVQLTVDGETSEVRTFGDSVEDVLAAADVKVSDRDLVAPSPDSDVQDGSEVVVQHARELTLTVDGETTTYWTTALTVDDALADVGVRADGAWLSASRSAPLGRQGLDLDVRTPKDVTLTVADEATSVTSTGETVADLLAEQGVELGDLDTVSSPVDTELTDGLAVAVTRIRTDRVTETVTVAAPVEKKSDTDLAAGKTKVLTAGKDGTTERVVRRTIVNGKVTGTKVMSSKVVTAPVAQVVAVGTKKAAPATPKTPSTAAPTGSVWDRLAQCESGGNWSINTGQRLLRRPAVLAPDLEVDRRLRLPAREQPRAADRHRHQAAGALGLGPVAAVLVQARSPLTGTTSPDGLLGPADVRDLAGRLGVRPTKTRGQNFVVDANTVRRIVRRAGVGPADVVVEIGPGLGSLTLGLLDVAAAVVAVEIDPVLARALPATVGRRRPDRADALDRRRGRRVHRAQTCPARHRPPSSRTCPTTWPSRSSCPSSSASPASARCW